VPKHDPFFEEEKAELPPFERGGGQNR